MNFTKFLQDPEQRTETPSFLRLASRDELWPRRSTRLADFEDFLASRIEEASGEAIADLRVAWRAYVNSGAGSTDSKADIDLGLAAWADYAAHLRTCRGTPGAPCETADELLERAIEDSGFDDARLTGRVERCEGAGPDDEEDPVDRDGEDDLDDEAEPGAE